MPSMVIRQSPLLDVQRFDHHKRRNTADNVTRPPPFTATMLKVNRLRTDDQSPSDLPEAERGRCLTTNESNNVSTLAKYEARVKSSHVSRNCSQNWKSGRFSTGASAGLSIMPLSDLPTNIGSKTPDNVLFTSSRLENVHPATRDAYVVELEATEPAASTTDLFDHIVSKEHNAAVIDSYSAGGSAMTPSTLKDLQTQQSSFSQADPDTTALPHPPGPWTESSAGLRRDSDTLPSLPATPNLVRERIPKTLSSHTSQVESASHEHSELLPPEHGTPMPMADLQSTSFGATSFAANMTLPVTWSNPSTEHSRDRYGFKKESAYFTTAQYDAWNSGYTLHLERRRKKWVALMKRHKLSTDEPVRFPPRSNKVRRYVRKGIPPEWRGAAWFWYGGGPSMIDKHPGLYQKMLHKISAGQLKIVDQENIERDLHRTFPDHNLFKPDPAGPNTVRQAQPSMDRDSQRHIEPPDTPGLASLRRVLQAFAVHKPAIGYCQSLNFLAAQLLVFLNSNEEKAFHMLILITKSYFPGTHGANLEGASTDIRILMNLVQQSMPAIWAKLDDRPAGSSPSEMPTTSLATTAWFMSALVNTLPPEPVARVWDCMFYGGSKAIFQTALAIFNLAGAKIHRVRDPMEAFQIIQTLPRGMLDANALMTLAARKYRGSYGYMRQEQIELQRAEQRRTPSKAKTATETHVSRGEVDGEKADTRRKSTSAVRMPFAGRKWK